MTVAQKIYGKLVKIMGKGDANACNIFKGYGARGRGWYYTPFGQVSVYLGKSWEEAKEALDYKIEEVEELKEKARKYQEKWGEPM